MDNCSFKYPSERVLNLKRALVPDDFKLMLPTGIAARVRKDYERPSTSSYARVGLSIPTRIANAVLTEVQPAAWDRPHPFPFKNLRLFEYQYMPLIGRLAAEGIEPYLPSLTPAWQPGDDKVDARTYQAVRDAVLQDENRYAELASRHLVRAHTRALAISMGSAMENDRGAASGHTYNKLVADNLKEYLPELCTAWRYAELVMAADDREQTRGAPVSIDWKELQKTYGPLRFS